MSKRGRRTFQFDPERIPDCNDKFFAKKYKPKEVVEALLWPIVYDEEMRLSERFMPYGCKRIMKCPACP